MRLGMGIIVLPCLLAACSAGGGDSGPFTDSRTPAGLAERFYPPEGWAWDLVQVGSAPAQRYGVAAAVGPARADILILPDYGESAETWFETVRDLTSRGYRVWVLEAAGQGGSERLRGQRDIGDVQSFDPDVAAVRAMIDTVIRPNSKIPLFVLANGVGAVIATPAMAGGAGVQGLIFSAPRLDVRRGGPVPASPPWRSDMKDAFAGGATHDRWRGAVSLAWQRANPDLRMGAASPRWEHAYHQAMLKTVDAMKAQTLPVMVIEGDRGVGCLGARRCLSVQLKGAGQALELERDAMRKAWLDRIDAFIAAAR